ncbi:hypothetical protein PQE68_gp255 [Bacillus phage vB_BanS_Sophrita]|uniref:Uncharacterized protein n=1 Tax=Bacillus phage vB_BanS_Sophrita TaxID=2894790 RepID=A0AAE8YUH9_9CAUD|nr:hypothetical protein PQE68_gp255 [Bacillus phage vB_BanS_Sophrita]UGO50827.1 hypothetical protein SOPHRITA_240 [Bacillus phage vB_BanS_Sophrita]
MKTTTAKMINGYGEGNVINENSATQWQEKNFG